MESLQCIVFNIFSCRVLIISYKMLILTEISNEKTNELTINAILCRNVTILYRQDLASSFKVQKKLKSFRNSNCCCFIAAVSLPITYVRLMLHVLVFSQHNILHFRDNFYLLKYYPVKVFQNCFNSLNCSNQTGMQDSKFSFVLLRL